MNWTNKTLQHRQSHLSTHNYTANHIDQENGLPELTTALPSTTEDFKLDSPYRVDPHTENAHSNNLLVNALLHSDTQQEDENVVIPDNLKFLSEAFSETNAAKL
ncbi:hypothetical protein K3495_g12388 [Podosphaera aphanis]|nr:hypothetical protein K3495_g12388 [Podosphaera aphanis]